MEFITKWNINNETCSIFGKVDKYFISLPLNCEYKFDFDIDWGDNTDLEHYTLDDDFSFESYYEKHGKSYDIIHYYNEEGIYTVKIKGKIGGWFRGDQSLIEICQWGCFTFDDKTSFDDSKNLTITAKDIPNLRGVTSLSSMFWKCDNFNSDLSMWDVSNIKNMSGMFQGCHNFNGNISNWNTSNVTNMAIMFTEASKFNQNLSNWDTSNVTNMHSMFSRCFSFNQPLSLNKWNISNVRNMIGMFMHTSKNNKYDWNISPECKTDWMYAYTK
jgi:surface protein